MMEVKGEIDANVTWRAPSLSFNMAIVTNDALVLVSARTVSIAAICMNVQKEDRYIGNICGSHVMSWCMTA